MTELERLEREMLNSLRSDLKPTAADRSRVGELLAHRLGLPALHSVPQQFGEASSSGVSSANASSLHSLSALKLGLLGSLLVGVGALVVVAVGPESATQPPLNVVTAPRVSEVARPLPARAEPVLSETKQVTDTSQAEQVIKVVRKQKAVSNSDLDAELRMLRDAHRANAQHQPQAALRIVQQIAARFPKGSLVEERQAVRVIALCQSGSGSAEQEARAFLARHPASVYGGRVKAACK